MFGICTIWGINNFCFKLYELMQNKLIIKELKGVKKNILFHWFRGSSTSSSSTVPRWRLQRGDSIGGFGRSWCRRHIVCWRSLGEKKCPSLIWCIEQKWQKMTKNFLSHLCWRPASVKEGAMVRHVLKIICSVWCRLKQTGHFSKETKQISNRNDSTCDHMKSWFPNW